MDISKFIENQCVCDTDTTISSNLLDALRGTLTAPQFEQVSKLMAEKDYLIYKNAKHHYEKGLRDGAQLAKKLKLA